MVPDMNLKRKRNNVSHDIILNKVIILSFFLISLSWCIFDQWLRNYGN